MLSRPRPPWRTGLRVARVLLGACVLSLAFPGCDDESDEPGPPRYCGNGECEASRCETMLRCPDDCGVCVGSSCNPTAALGSCGDPCESSCDCVPQSEYCTADYGQLPGVCVPIGCLECIASCQYTPDADGVCATPSCP